MNLLLKGSQVVDEEIVIGVIIVSLVVGTLKYVWIIRRASQRLIKHIRSQNEPIALKNVYPVRVYPVIVIMIAIGPIIKYSGIPSDAVAVIDFIVAVALLNGASDFLREALFPKKIIFK